MQGTVGTVVTGNCCTTRGKPAASFFRLLHHTHTHVYTLVSLLRSRQRCAPPACAPRTSPAWPPRPAPCSGSGGPQAARGSVSRLMCVHQAGAGRGTRPVRGVAPAGLGRAGGRRSSSATAGVRLAPAGEEAGQGSHVQPQGWRWRLTARPCCSRFHPWLLCAKEAAAPGIAVQDRGKVGNHGLQGGRGG